MRQARFHGAFGNPKRGRGLLAVELEEVATGNHVAVLLAQGVHEAEQTAAFLGCNRRRLGGWGRIPRAEALRQSQLELLAAARPAGPGARLLLDHPQQPLAAVRPRAER